MARSRVLTAFVVLVAASLVLVSCSSASKAPAGNAPAAPASPSAPATPAAQAPTSKTQLRLGTTNVGGTYYITATAYAQTMSKFAPEIQINVEVTGGSVDNLNLLARGETELGMAIAPLTWQAAKGEGKFKEPVKLAAITAVNLGRTHVVVRKGSGIKTIADMKGRKISTAEPGNSTEIIATQILAAAGIDVDKGIKRYRTNLNDSMEALANGSIDGFFYVSGAGVPAIVEAGKTTGKVELIAIEQSIIDKLVKDVPYFVKTEIPKDMYGNSEALPTLGSPNHLLCQPNLAEDVVYKIVSTLFEHRDNWVNAHSSCKEQTLEFGPQGSPVPYHPGAIKYYKEKGVWKE